MEERELNEEHVFARSVIFPGLLEKFQANLLEFGNYLM